VPIDVPVWDSNRGSGNNYDYHVVRFATIALTSYRLNGNGWLSFTYLGAKNCFNQPPMAQPLSYETNEEQPLAVTLSGSDPDGDALSYTLLSQPAHGVLSGTAPDLVYTPAVDYSGGDSFTYVVNDGLVDSAPAVVDITVLPINDAPVAFNQQLEFAEDTSVPLTLTWQDVDGDTVTATILTQPLNGTLAGSGFNYSYTPDANFVGDDSFTFKVNDGELDSNVATVLLTANPVNDAPVADDGSATTLEDEPVVIVLSASDVDGDALSYSILANPASGSLQSLGGNTVEYTPAPGFFGNDLFTFYVNDGQLDSNVATVTIEVIEKNKPPVIISTAVEQGFEGTPYSYLAEAVDPNAGDVLAFALQRAPAGMTIDGASGAIAWLPQAKFVGGLQSVNRYCSLTSYDETYRALDLVFLTDTSDAVTLPAALLDAVAATIEPALVALDIGAGANPNQYGLLSIEAAATAVNVGGQQLYPAADVPLASAQLAPGAGLVADGLAALQAVLDQYPLRAPVAKHLVLGINDVPAAIDSAVMAALSTQLQTEDHKLSVIADVSFQCDSGELAMGVDANNNGYLLRDGQVEQCSNPVLLAGDDAVLASYAELALASGGSVWDLAQASADAVLFEQVFSSYLAGAVVDRFSVPQADLFIDSITLDPNDPLQATAVVRNRGLGAPGQAVNLAIAGRSGDVEYPLLSAVIDNLGAAEAESVSFSLPFEHNFDALSAAVDALPLAQECVADNNSRLVPLVALQVADPEGLTDTQAYAISVHELNEAPEIISDAGTTAHIDQEYRYHVRATDPDLGDLVRYSLLTAPDGMWVHPISGLIRWTPQAADSGDVTVDVQVTDIAGASDTQLFIIAVGDFNNPPVIVTTPLYTADLGQLYYYDVNATDADGDTLAYSLLEGPAGASINSATGEIQWPADHVGVESFSVQVSDGRGGFDSQQFDVTVVDSASNAPPLAFPASYETGQNQAVDTPLQGQDPNGDPLGFTIVTPPQHGTLLGEGAAIRYLPDAYYAGPDSFEFAVDDGRLGSLPAVVSIEVLDQNNAPIITSEPELPFVLEPAAGNGEPVDLNLWNFIDLGIGSQGKAKWTINTDGTQADQTVNARASVLLSDFDVATDQMSGIWRVRTTSDDDFMGFVFGWQNQYQYYLFDWKENTQNSALRGMSVKVINLAPDGSEGKPNLWGTYNATVDTLYHNSIRWYPHTDYDFTLTFHPGEFTITVKQGATVIDSFTLQDDTFLSGQFGFYNYSQHAVRYRGFTREILASREYVYDVEAYDPDGDDLTYALVSGPDGMTLDPETGLINWQTTSEDAGTYEVLVQVTDPHGASAIQRYDLVVVEQVPVITTDPAEEALTDQAYVYDVAAIDPNPDDALSFSLTQAPAGMAIDADSGVVSWNPTLAELGPHDVVIRVTDTGGYFSEQSYVLTVVETPSNVAPEFTSAPPATASVGGSYAYTPTATDADGDTVSFSLIDVPAGMQMFDGETITWRPTADQVTRHELLIEVGDGRGGVALQAFTVDVTGPQVNHAPQITSQPGSSIDVGGEYEYIVQATDVDGDTLSYELVDGPVGMLMDHLGVVRWMPIEVGYYPVSVRVTDSRGGYTTQSFTLAVFSTLLNAAPAISSTPVASAYLGARYEYRLQATDTDGDPIIYSVVEGPAGLSINPNTGVVNWVPGDSQLGDHPVALKAYDGRGGSTIQSFTLAVVEQTSNLPPQITSTPATVVTLGDSYAYQLLASDPESNVLTYSLDTAPSGMTMDASGAVSFAPVVGQEGLHTVVLSVSDGIGGTATQTYTLAVDDGTGYTGNLAPVISSDPDNQATAGSPYSYQVMATDPEGSALTYQLAAAPAGMGISATGLINWTPLNADVGIHSVLVEVADADGAATQQHYTLSVFGTAGNQAPQIVNLPSTSAKEGLSYQFQIEATDADGDVLSYSLTQGGAGATVSATGLLTWTPATTGPQPTTVRVSDGIVWVELGWTIEVVPASTQMEAVIVVTPEVADAGESIHIQVVASGSAGDTTTSITVDGVDVPLASDNSATITESVIGPHDIVARVSDAYDTIVERKTFYIRDPNDLSVPLAVIENVEDAQEVSAPVDIVATISDDNLSTWSLKLYSLAGEAAPLEIATGTTAVNSAVIAQLDPTLLDNGLYRLQLEALDDSRNTGVDARTVRLTGDMKVGNFSFTVTDLEIPVSGIPIRVNRTYDSRRRHQAQDFGYGWSLDYQNVKIEESRPAGRGWALNDYTYGPLGALVDFCIQPLGKPLVTVTLPTGAVETFEVHVSPECNQFLPLTDVELDFVPIDGTTSTLEQTDYGLLRFNADKLVQIAGDQEPDPTHYLLTTKDGYVYELDQEIGLRTITDPNGNTLTYTDNGIFHSDGKSVLFERDGNGQVTALIDPAGERYEYTRDGNGDLTIAADPLGAESTYTYNSEHGLLEMYDALGRKLIKNIYDDDGRLIAQEDGDGNRTDYDHDIAGRQSIVTNRRGYSTQLFYNEEGYVTDEVDALGNITSYTYDADGNLTSRTNALGDTTSATFNDRRDQLNQTDELGNTVSFTYNLRGQELTATDARGNLYTQDYDRVGNLLTVEGPLDNVSGNVIDVKGHVIRSLDAESNVTSFSYDDEGNKLTEKDPEGHTTRYTYDDNGNVLTESRVRDGVTEVTTYTYDTRDRLIETEDATGNITTTEYDLAGNEVAMVDAQGRRTEYAYDAYTRLTLTTYPDGTTASNTYDVQGNLVTETDRLGRTTQHSYDPLDRLVQTTWPDGTSSHTEYDVVGRVTAEIDENGNRTEYEYDAAGRRTATIDAQGNTHSFEYDADGNLTAEVDALARRTEYVYNALDQRVETLFHDGSTTVESYDALGRRTSMTDQSGIVTDYAYDGLGRLITVTDALDGVTAFTYDSVGNKLTQADAENRTTHWAYDALGRPSARTLPMGQLESFSYDGVGNPTQRVDFNGQVTASSYDLNDRLTQRSFDDGSSEDYSYDAVGNLVQVIQTAADASTRTTSYAYDSRDRLISHTQANGAVLAYGYDAAGNRTSLTVTSPTGTVTTTSYGFDSLNRLASVTDDNGLTSYGYDAVGNLTSVSHPNGSSQVYSYDSLNRLTRLSTYDGGGALIEQYDYSLNASGRRTQIDELDGRSTSYSYDDLYRLTAENVTDAVNGDYNASYQYDAVGNRTQSVIDGVTTAYSYDANDRLTQQGGSTYTYDANGNTLTETLDGDVTSYTYNAKDRLVAVEQGGDTTSFAYDHNGIRNARTEFGVTTDLVIDVNRDYAQVVEEVTAGSIDASYSYGHDLLSQERGGADSYYHYDGLGSTRLLTDELGGVTDEYDYEVFGGVLNQSGVTENTYLFTGESYDATLDQYYLRARYYDQGIGRFTQQDTWMGNNSDPVTLHKYLYANADPALNIDPSGHFSLGSIGAANSIRANLTVQQINAGLSILDIALNGPEAETLNPNPWAVGLAAMGGPAAYKLLKMLSGKFRKMLVRGDGPGCNSFAADTLVHTEEGLKPISDIEIGDKVWAFDEEIGEKRLQEVVHLIQGEGLKDLVDIELANGDVITATAGHPFYVSGQWLDAGDLSTGHSLLGSDGEPLGVHRIVNYSQEAEVFNLTINHDHTYFVGDQGALAHNIGGCKLRETVLNTGSYEAARNKALLLLGRIDPTTRVNIVGRLPASRANGKIVGFETKVDGIWKQYRIDYDPNKGTHINVRVGKGEAMMVNKAIKFPGGEDEFMKLIRVLNR